MRHLFIFISLLVSISLQSQVLSKEMHLPIPTDSIIVYRQPYIANADSGENCYWDYSSATIMNPVYIDFYKHRISESNMGMHYNHYNTYLQELQDTLFTTGYENAQTTLNFSQNEKTLIFPFHYGDTLISIFRGGGEFCHTLPVSIEGTTITIADATGTLILPEDTIKNILRIHQRRTYREIVRQSSFVTEDTYYWYSERCRYPLYVAQRLCTEQKTDTIVFETAYYFPQELTEEIRIDDTIPQTKTNIDSVYTDATYLPNPVQDNLMITYRLTRDASVSFSLHGNGGLLFTHTPTRQEEAGWHTTTINMSSYPIGTYILYIHVDDLVQSQTIIKL